MTEKIKEMKTEEKVSFNTYPRHEQRIMKGNFAASEAAKLCRIGFIPAYPITPQTTIVEDLSDKVGSGELDAEYVNMDSEHSVFAAAMGAALTGERVFTATAGQGLFYAHEVLHAIAHYRLPMVVCNVGRPSIPWNIWSDQTDSLAQRDTGWVQFYGESSQEVLDTVIQAYIIAETLDLPVFVVLDAFYQSHTSENVWVPDQSLVDEFLPPKKSKPYEIDVTNPKAVGGLVQPEHYGKFNYEYWVDLLKVEDLANEVGEKFGKHFGRDYRAVEAVNIGPQTKMVLVTISSITTTARGVIRNHPDVGLLKLRLFHPFPKNSVLEAVKDLSNDVPFVTIERNFVGDKVGAIKQEMERAFYRERSNPIYDAFTGHGGKDVPPVTIEKIIYRVKNNPKDVTWIDVE
jgi:pyruvate/2-oxoacid:ferredoxin oxidoreductase alpha subunit